MSIKIEPRGKYSGCKIHLDSEEVTSILKGDSVVMLEFCKELAHLIKDLLKKEPDLLKDRTPEQVAAILAKEVEKASLQLNAVKSGKQWQKVDPIKLQEALNKHVK